MQPRTLAVVATIALIALIAGCSGDDYYMAEASYYAEHEGFRARVWIPLHEARSIGTYRAEVEWPDGTKTLTEAERDGMITGVWLCDLVSDGASELVVATSSAGSGGYGSADVHQLRDGELRLIALRPLGDEQRPGYMGHDAFSVEDGRLYRSFPQYDEDDVNAAPSGGIRQLLYSFPDSAWVSAEGGGATDRVMEDDSSAR